MSDQKQTLDYGRPPRKRRKWLIGAGAAGVVAVSRNQKEWDQANKDYYSRCDWALDISKAEFQGSISLEAIPGSLIRRDEETQALVRRDRLEASDWKSLDYGRSAYKICIDWFLSNSQYDDVVLVAEKKSKRFKENLAVLAMLRREGIAQ